MKALMLSYLKLNTLLVQIFARRNFRGISRIFRKPAKYHENKSREKYFLPLTAKINPREINYWFQYNWEICLLWLREPLSLDSKTSFNNQSYKDSIFSGFNSLMCTYFASLKLNVTKGKWYIAIATSDFGLIYCF